MTEATDQFVVRLWDGMDGVWIDVCGPTSKDEAERIYNENTNNSTRKTKYEDIDYYRIFPADTAMFYSNGHCMHREAGE